MTDDLSTDLQHALQQAVVEANDAAQLSKKKHKKKRSRDDDGDGQPEGEHVKPKKKKKTRPAEASAEAAPSVEQLAMPDAVLAAEATSDKSKKKKKDKGKEPVIAQPPAPELEVHQVPPVTDDVLATSSADFLSAVVAAASATSHLQDNVPPPYPPQPMPPYPPYPEHMVQYHPPPPPGYPYPPHPPPPPPFGPPGMYPDLNNILPDLNLASSEELLRTLQDMDIAKLASVLKTLGEAGVPTPSNVTLNIPPSFIPPPAPPGPPPVNQVSAKSVAILGRHPKQAKESGTSTRTLPPPAHLPAPPRPPEEDNPDHAHMLANVWMNASKLAEMVKTQGLVYKKGKFSAIEDAQLRAAIENFRINKGMTEQDITALIFSKDRGRGEAFWQEITSALHLRPITAVYHHVRRLWHPLRGQGRWMPAEDENLRDAVAQLGQQWEKISERVGRTASDCRDRWRNHLEGQEVRRTGHWTKEEEEELTKIVTELTVLQGKDMDNDIFWGAVSQRMGGRRGRQQCRIKWTDSLSTQIKNEGAKPRWSQLDAYILVHKIDSLKVNDDSEIDWKKLPDEHWNIWSAHTLQRRWLTMKRSIKGYEEMTHAELMDILRTKKAQTPPPQTTSRSRSQKQPRSAETIADSDVEEEDDNSTTRPSSNLVHVA